MNIPFKIVIFYSVKFQNTTNIPIPYLYPLNKGNTSPRKICELDDNFFSAKIVLIIIDKI